MPWRITLGKGNGQRSIVVDFSPRYIPMSDPEIANIVNAANAANPGLIKFRTEPDGTVFGILNGEVAAQIGLTVTEV